MQKLRLSIVLALCMLLAFSAFATETETVTTGVTITAADATVANGVADVVITVNSDVEFAAVRFSVNAPEGVTLDKWESSVGEAKVEGTTAATNEGWNIVTKTGRELPMNFAFINLTADAKIENATLTLTFVVAETYTEDTADVTVTAIEAVKFDESAVAVSATGATITVVTTPACDHTNTKLVNNGDGTHDVVCADDTCGYVVEDNATCEGDGVLTSATRETDAYYTYTCDCGYSYDEEVKGEITVSWKHTTEIQSAYILKFRVPTTDAGTAFSDHWMTITRYPYVDEDGNYTTDGTTTPVTAVVEAELVGNRYDFKSPGIAAKNMGDKVVGTYYQIVDGIKYTANVDVYNLVSYYNAAVNAGVAEVPLLKEMMNYGAAAQVNFGYNTTKIDGDPNSGLINLNLPEADQKNALDEFDTSVTAERIEATYAEEAYDFRGSAAELNDAITLVSRYYVKKTPEADRSTLKFVGTYSNINGEPKTIEISGSDFEDYGTGSLQIKISDPAVKDLACDIVGAIYDADGNRVSNELTVSYVAYAQLALKASSVSANEKLAHAAAINYCKAAQDFFANK